MRALIWGAGAIGGTLGAYLARAGHAITLVDVVEEHVREIRRSGLRITGPIGEFTTPVPAFTPDALEGQWETVILATKAHHTEAAAQALRPHVSGDGCVVSAQNGLNEIALSRIVGAERTVGSFVNFGADYLEPGVIHYGGHGAVVIGEIDGRITPRVESIRDAVRHGADQRVDRRRARESGASRSLHRARARDQRGRPRVWRDTGGLRRVRSVSL
jgi:2-dehydropantoate 2-reductase